MFFFDDRYQTFEIEKVEDGKNTGFVRALFCIASFKLLIKTTIGSCSGGQVNTLRNLFLILKS